MDNSGREELLLEVIKDFTGITYPEYSNDNDIKKKIYQYILIRKRFTENPDDVNFVEMQKLRRLHRFFYGSTFNPENPDANIYKTSIYKKFKSVFDKVEKLVTETNDINADLLKSLISIISVKFDSKKNNKDDIINEYLNNTIIPLINSYKGIGVVADLKEEAETIPKNTFENQIEKEVINKKDEQDKQKETDKNKKINDAKTKAKERADKAIEDKKTRINANKETGVKPVVEADGTVSTGDKADGTGVKTADETGVKAEKKPDDKADGKKLFEIAQETIKNQLEKPNTTTEPQEITFKIDDVEFDYKEKDYIRMKEYLQALYLPLEFFDDEYVNLINDIIEEFNKLDTFKISEYDPKTSKDKFLKNIDDDLEKYLKEKHFDINKIFESYINETNNFDDVNIILSLFRIQDKTLKFDETIKDEKYKQKLNFLSKLINCKTYIEASTTILNNDLLILFTEFSELNNDYKILDIINYLKFLITIIKKFKITTEYSNELQKINFKNDELIETYIILINLLASLSEKLNIVYYDFHIHLKLFRFLIKKNDEEAIKKLINYLNPDISDDLARKIMDEYNTLKSKQTGGSGIEKEDYLLNKIILKYLKYDDKKIEGIIKGDTELTDDIREKLRIQKFLSRSDNPLKYKGDKLGFKYILDDSYFNKKKHNKINWDTIVFYEDKKYKLKDVVYLENKSSKLPQFFEKETNYSNVNKYLTLFSLIEDGNKFNEFKIEVKHLFDIDIDDKNYKNFNELFNKEIEDLKIPDINDDTTSEEKIKKLKDLIEPKNNDLSYYIDKNNAYKTDVLRILFEKKQNNYNEDIKKILQENDKSIDLHLKRLEYGNNFDVYYYLKDDNTITGGFIDEFLLPFDFYYFTSSSSYGSKNIRERDIIRKIFKEKEILKKNCYVIHHYFKDNYSKTFEIPLKELLTLDEDDYYYKEDNKYQLYYNKSFKIKILLYKRILNLFQKFEFNDSLKERGYSKYFIDKILEILSNDNIQDYYYYILDYLEETGKLKQKLFININKKEEIDKYKDKSYEYISFDKFKQNIDFKLIDGSYIKYNNIDDIHYLIKTKIGKNKIKEYLKLTPKTTSIYYFDNGELYELTFYDILKDKQHTIAGLSSTFLKKIKNIDIETKIKNNEKFKLSSVKATASAIYNATIATLSQASGKLDSNIDDNEEEEEDDDGNNIKSKSISNSSRIFNMFKSQPSKPSKIDAITQKSKPLNTDDNEEEEEEQDGGFKNIIELEDVFKLYFNSDEEITNIYKLYFIINIYGFYNEDNEEIKDLLEIIKIDVFNDDIIDTIKSLTTKIYHNSMGIYEDYLRFFDITDTIIKNFCQKRTLILKYLNMNFIYEFYKNYQKKDINIQININGTILKINKSLTEIKKEIDEIFINGEGLFPKSSYVISINSYDNEIDNFIHFIYEFTKNEITEITNLNDLNAYIVLQLLSNENDIISLSINDEIFTIDNIDNHPYKLHMTDNFDIKIKLNDVQMRLYKKLFGMENKQSLLGILGKEFYYLDFNIKEKSKFKFHLNYEIIPFISYSNLDENFKRTIINYNSFKPMMIDELSNLSILSIEKNFMIFLINYGILIGSTLFSQINIKNFITLIYIYFTIKNNTRKYLELYNYNGENSLIIIYRDYIKSVNFISFIKSILFLMRIKLNLNMNLKNFIQNVIQFKDKFVIKTPIKIDVNFIQTLFNTTSYTVDEKFIEIFYSSFLLVYKNCVKRKANNDVIKMLNIYLIPCLRFFNNKINIRDVENEVLDIKAMEYLRLIGNLKKGGEIELPKNPVNFEKAKKELKEGENVELTTDLKDNSKEILKLLEVFNNFYNELNKLDVEKLKEKFKTIIEIYFKILDGDFKDEKGQTIVNIYIITPDKKDLFVNLKDVDQKDVKKELQKIITINDKINFNETKIKELIEEFSYETNDENKIHNLNDLAKNLKLVLKLLNDMKISLENEKDGIKKFKGKSIEIDNIFDEFYPKEENEKSLMDILEDFVFQYKKKIDKFIKILKDTVVKYESLKKELDENTKNQKDFIRKKEEVEARNINERQEELKQKIKGLNKQIDENKNNINKYKTQIDEYNKANVEPDKIKLLDEKIKTLDNENISLKQDLKKLEDELKEERMNKKGGAFDVKDDNDIGDLLNKDITFKDKDEDITFEERKNQIKKRFDNIKKDYRKLKVSTYIPNSAHKDQILEKFIDNKGNTLFEQILNNYAKDIKEKNYDIANANFYESVENNNLDPLKELELTFNDKLIFAFLIIFLRYGALYTTYKFIDNKFVKSIKEAIIYYSISYVAILFLFVVIVNVDLFRLRIVFNYCNLHINSSGILSHMVIKIIIGYIIYLLIINLDNEPIPTYLSKNQIIKLKNKLDILSMIVLVFLLIFVIII